MEVCRRSSWLIPLLGVILLAQALQGVQGEAEVGPSESECRPYIEKALRNLETVDAGDADVGQSQEQTATSIESSIGDAESEEKPTSESADNFETQESHEESEHIAEETITEETESETVGADVSANEEESQDGKSQENSVETLEIQSAEEPPEEPVFEETSEQSAEDKPEDVVETTAENLSAESIEETKSMEDLQEQTTKESGSGETQEVAPETQEQIQESSMGSEEALTENQPSELSPDADEILNEVSSETENLKDDVIETETATEIEEESTQEKSMENENVQESAEKETLEESREKDTLEESKEESKLEESKEEENQQESSLDITEEVTQSVEETSEEKERSKRSLDDVQENENEQSIEEVREEILSDEKKSEEEQQIMDDQSLEQNSEDIKEPTAESQESKEIIAEEQTTSTPSQEIPADNEVMRGSSGEIQANENDTEIQAETEKEVEGGISEEEVKGDEKSAEANSQMNSMEEAPEEELINIIDIPENLRPRDHVEQLLKLDREATKSEEIINRISDITLRELKRLYENAIKPLETLYKYRDLSNRHYGDSEIFSKPLILFMGPWSGGKSSIINYLLDIEYNDMSLRTGAEPSPAYFNLLMYGDEEEVLDGTQLAADYTFSGLQKFGQGLEERLRGLKLQSKLLEKVNIVEIPGILEVRKQVSRVFPFNDACQWFIDRADIIFLVYDPSKLDVGPETEAILDQLKGREYQTRIVLNKADQVKPEELMRVQGALIWNISPLMSSPQPPVMYTTSLWSKPYEQWAPIRLLQSQERAFLRDLRSAIDRRIENKIASARRFAVRVRNHAKMVDCYLTTYYNHKSIFGNRKLVSDAIIEHPQDYHIYEGLSTLTNISRYDLPDPDVYRDFFRLNPLYEFQQLSATCTYFRGCPINKLDVAIAYDLPELVGKHKRMVESALAESNKEQPQGS